MNRIYFFIVVILLCSCSNRENSYVSNLKVLDVNSLSSDLDISTFVDSISYVTFSDSLSESVFSEISKCQIYNGNIYILDFAKTKTVMVFNINGDYLFTIGKKGNGPGEFVRVIDFDVNASGIYTLDRSLKKIMHFSLDGHFLKEYSYLNCEYIINGLAITSDGNFVLGMDKENNNLEKLLLVDPNFHIIKHLDSFSEYDTEGELKLDAVKRCGENVIFHYPISNKIYILDTLGVEKETLDIKLGGKDIPNDLKKSFEKLEENNDDYIYFYNTPFVTSRYILSVLSYHSIQALFFLDRVQNKYFLNKYTKEKTYDIKKMLFPVFANDNIIACYLDQYFYDRTKNVVLSEQQRKYLEEGGTILVIYYLKKK